MSTLTTRVALSMPKGSTLGALKDALDLARGEYDFGSDATVYFDAELDELVISEVHE